MVEHTAEAVGQHNDAGPRQVLDQPADEDLGQHLGDDDVSDARVVAHQLLDLRVLAQDLPAA